MRDDVAFPESLVALASTKGKALCLNMIVKNEVANLDRCLRSVADHIACWVIGDTGSSDGTQDFIQEFFRERGIPGELHSFPFEDFEQARNEALACAFASTLSFDYLLLADADMELIVEDPAFREKLRAPGHALIQRAGISYWNTRLVRRDVAAKYCGVTHEYLDVPGEVERLHGVWYKDHASGANRIDKHERDIRLLLDGIASEPENQRYWFYLAQSYREAGRTLEAAEAYAIRAEMGGWAEEAWYARRQEAKCRLVLGDEPAFLRLALAAFNERPHRAEPLYDLVKYHSDRGQNDTALIYCEIGLGIPYPPDSELLFIEDYIYQVGFKEQYSIIANYSRDKRRWDKGRRMCDWLALSPDGHEGARGLARHNTLFYATRAAEFLPSLRLQRIVGFAAPQGFHLTAASIAEVGGKLVAALGCSDRQPRLHWHELSAPGAPPVTTRNFVVEFGHDFAVCRVDELHHPEEMPAPISARQNGMAELRIFDRQGEAWAFATAPDPGEPSLLQIVQGRLVAREGGGVSLSDCRVLPKRLQIDDATWMPQIDRGVLRHVLLQDPVRVLDEQGGELVVGPSPVAAGAVSVGSSLVAFDGGWLSVVHTYNVVGEERRYGHRFLWLDAEYRPAQISRCFTLRGRHIECVAGLAQHPNSSDLVLSFTVNDAEAWMGVVPAAELRAGLVPLSDLLSEGEPAVPTAPVPPVPSPATTTRSSPLRAAVSPSSRSLRFHILGIPHTASNREYLACAYTQKVVKLCRMLKERGHTVIHYGNEASDVMCDEHVTVTTEADLLQAYGFQEWKTNMFRFDVGDHAYQTFYRNAIEEVGRRKRPNDFLLCMWGFGHKPVADAHGDMIVVEPGIGYAGGQFAKFRIYESYAMYHASYGVGAVERADRVDWYAAVIPNFFNLDEFEFSAEKHDYFLYLGRVMSGKGVHIALQVAEHVGARLIVAGQGSLADLGYQQPPANVEFVGFADVATRKRLMSHAKGLFLPSMYIEPFGGVQIESLLSGTPTITTDWGAFAENNLHGITGFRCRTFDHFVWAARNIDRIDPYACRRWAESNFSIERVGDMYEEYFQYVTDVFTGRGWYQLHPERTSLDWLAKQYPEGQPPTPAQPAISAPGEAQAEGFSNLPAGTLSPVPGDAAGSESVNANLNYWDPYNWVADGDEWQDQAQMCRVPYPEWKASLVSHLIEPYARDANVLEIACGHGRWSEAIVPICRHATLIDLSPKAVEFCRTRFAKHENVSYFVTPGAQLPPGASGTMDFVFSYDAFVHMGPDVVEEYTAEIARVLRPGGVAILHHADITDLTNHQQADAGRRSAVNRGLVRDFAKGAGLVVFDQATFWDAQGKYGCPGDAITFLRKESLATAHFPTEAQPPAPASASAATE